MLTPIYNTLSRLILFNSFLLLLFFGCRKSTKEIAFNGTFKSESILIVEKPVMYTAGNRTDDANIIKDYLQRHGITDFKFETKTETDTVNTTISFEDSSKVSVQSGNNKYRAKIKTQTASNFILANLDSISNVEYFPIPRCQSLVTIMNETPAAKTCIKIQVSSGLVDLCTYKLLHQLDIESNQLTMPLLTTVTSSQQCYTILLNAWMKQKTNLQSTLITGDTIIIQVKKRKFTKI